MTSLPQDKKTTDQKIAYSVERIAYREESYMLNAIRSTLTFILFASFFLILTSHPKLTSHLPLLTTRLALGLPERDSSMARDSFREAPGLTLLRPTSFAQDGSRQDLERALTEGKSSFIRNLREILARRSVVTPIPGEENTEIKASSAILLRFHENGWQVFLVQRRLNARRYPGFWVFPSETREESGVNGRELPLEAILRGLSEELEITLTREEVLGRLGKYLTGDKKAVVSPILFIISDEESKKIKVNPEENAEGRWVPVSLFLERTIRQDGFLPEETFGRDAKFGPIHPAIDFAEVVRQAQEASAGDGGTKAMYEKAVQALREAEKSPMQGLEKYDRALFQFAQYLRGDEDARFFLVAPFVGRTGGLTMDETLPVPPMFMGALERLMRVTSAISPSSISDHDRGEILPLLVASTQFWPVTKERRAPDEAKKIIFQGYRDTPLVGHFFKAQDTSKTKYPTVIMLGPFGQSVLVLRDYVTFLQENYNVNVLLLEMRHHGESGGEFSSLGYLENRDLPFVVEQLLQDQSLRVDAENLIGYGFSLGTYVWLMAEKARLVKPKALILDTLPLFEKTEEGTVDWGAGWEAFSFGLPREYAEETMEMHRRILRHHLKFSGIDLSEQEIFQDPYKLIRGIVTPSLVLIETKDKWAHPGRAEKTWRVVEEEKRNKAPLQYVLSQGDHARGFVDDPEAYRAALRTFLDPLLPHRETHPEAPGPFAQDGEGKLPRKPHLKRLVITQHERHIPTVESEEMKMLLQFAETHHLPRGDFEKGARDPHILYRLAATLRLYDALQLEEGVAVLLFHYFLHPDWSRRELGRALGRSTLWVHRSLSGFGTPVSPYREFVEFIQGKDPIFLSRLLGEGAPNFSKEILITAIHSDDFTDADRRALGKRIDLLLESESRSSQERGKLITLKVFLGLKTPFAPESPRRRTFEETAALLSMTRKGPEKRIYGYIEKGALEIFQRGLTVKTLQHQDRKTVEGQLNRLLESNRLSEKDRKKLLTLKVYLGFETDFASASEKKRSLREAADILSQHFHEPTTRDTVKSRIGGSVSLGALDVLSIWFEVDEENLYGQFYPRFIGEARRRLFRERIERPVGEDVLASDQRRRLGTLWVLFQGAVMGERVQKSEFRRFSPSLQRILQYRIEGKTAKEISSLSQVSHAPLSEVTIQSMTREDPYHFMPPSLEWVEERVKTDQFPPASARLFWRKRFLGGEGKMSWGDVPPEFVAEWHAFLAELVDQLATQTGKSWETLSSSDYYRVKLKFPDETKEKPLGGLYRYYDDLKKKDPDPEARALITSLYIVRKLAKFSAAFPIVTEFGTDYPGRVRHWPGYGRQRMVSSRKSRKDSKVNDTEKRILQEFAETHKIPRSDFEKAIEDPYILYQIAAALRLYDDLLLDEESTSLLFHYFLYPERSRKELAGVFGKSVVWLERHLHGFKGAVSPYKEFVEYLEKVEPELLKELVGEEKGDFSVELLKTAIYSQALTDGDRQAIGRAINLLHRLSPRREDRIKLATLQIYLGLETALSPFGLEGRTIPGSPTRRTMKETAKILSEATHQTLSLAGVKVRIQGQGRTDSKEGQIGAVHILGRRYFEIDPRFYDRSSGETRRRIFKEKIENEEGEGERVLQRGRILDLWIRFRKEKNDSLMQSHDLETIRIVQYRIEGRSSREIASILSWPTRRVLRATREEPVTEMPSILEKVSSRLKEDRFPLVSSEHFWRRRFLARKWKMSWGEIPLEVLAKWIEQLATQVQVEDWEALTQDHYHKVPIQFPGETRTRSLATLYHYFYVLRTRERDPEKKALLTRVYIARALASYRPTEEKTAADGGNKTTSHRPLPSLRTLEPLFYP